jgi:hypothetical protein
VETARNNDARARCPRFVGAVGGGATPYNCAFAQRSSTQKRRPSRINGGSLEHHRHLTEREMENEGDYGGAAINEGGEPDVQLTLAGPRGLTTLLQAMKIGSKQVTCGATIAAC